MRQSRILGAALGLCAGLGAGFAFAQAKPPATTLADPLLGSRVQMRLLQLDDAADGVCARKLFAAAQVARQPQVERPKPRVEERRWVEMWTLDRCGRRIDYWIFFSDLGDGGAYFSVEPVL